MCIRDSPKEVLHEDDQVTLRIIKIEPDSHRIGLSLRRVESLAFADMDLKELEKELEDADITITSDEKPAQPEESAEEQTQEELDETPEAVEEEAESDDVAAEEAVSDDVSEESETTEDTEEE